MYWKRTAKQKNLGSVEGIIVIQFFFVLQHKYQRFYEIKWKKPYKELKLCYG